MIIDLGDLDKCWELLTKITNMKQTEIMMNSYLPENKRSYDWILKNIDKNYFSNCKFIVFNHVITTGNTDEIFSTGIRDSQYVLSKNTFLNTFLHNNDIYINVAENEISYQNNVYNYKNSNPNRSNFPSKMLSAFNINGFYLYSLESVQGYKSTILEYPEILNDILKYLPINSVNREIILSSWTEQTIPYLVKAVVPIEKVLKFDDLLDQILNTLAEVGSKHEYPRSLSGSEVIQILDNKFISKQEIKCITEI